MLSYFKLRAKKMFLVVLISCLVGLLYLGYFFTIGVPKTQSRNYYNLALSMIEKENYESAESHLKTALAFWNENYIQEKLLEVQSAKNK